jgi:hypothetical protein
VDNTPDASVDDVMKALNMEHSFALEARVRNISPNDLIVYAYPTTDIPLDSEDSENSEEDKPSLRRNLERVLQILTDPVCGRR